MSSFEYNQHRIREIYETIQTALHKNGTKKSKDELWAREDYYEKYPEELFHPRESKAVIKIFKNGIKALKLAEVYAERIDKYLSGDDGEDSLIQRLKEDLDKLKSNK